MIFVTVGTHEQPFNRLVKEIDLLKKKEIIKEEVIIQTGFSTYIPQYCEWKKLFPYSKMEDLVTKARIIITHGGPSSFIMPLQIGKIPIVVPRQKQFEEHVNDHQVLFCEAVSERQGNIIMVKDVEKLGETILNYENMVLSISSEIESNNNKFCSRFEKIIEEIFE